MGVTARVAPRGNATVYVEHGVWWDPESDHVHVTVPGARGAHKSYAKGTKWYEIYKQILIDAGRWYAKRAD